jgi:hypothetical protein
VSQLRIGFQEIINEAVDLSHLVYNRNQRGRSPGAKCFRKLFFTPLTTLTFNPRLALI